MKDKKNLFSLIILYQRLLVSKILKKNSYIMNHYLTSFINLIICQIVCIINNTLKLHEHNTYIYIYNNRRLLINNNLIRMM